MSSSVGSQPHSVTCGAGLVAERTALRLAKDFYFRALLLYISSQSGASDIIETQQESQATHGSQRTKLQSASSIHPVTRHVCPSRVHIRAQSHSNMLEKAYQHVYMPTSAAKDQGWQHQVLRLTVASSTEMLGRHMLSKSRHCQHLLLTYHSFFQHNLNTSSILCITLSTGPREMNTNHNVLTRLLQRYRDQL